MMTENNLREELEQLSIFDPCNEDVRIHADRYWHAPVKLDTVMSGVIAGSVAGIVGAGSTGKGFFALGACMDLFTGNNYLGLGIGASDSSPKLTPEQKIAFITLEDVEQVVGNRLHYMQREQGMSATDSIRFKEQVHTLSLVGKNFEGFVDNKGNMNMTRANEIIKIYRGYRVIFFDTLARIHQANENDNGDMVKLLNVLEYIAHNTGAAVIFIHHTSKNANMNGLGGEAGASRGAVALSDNIRCQINLSKMTEAEAEKHQIPESQRENYVMYRNSKINYAKSGGVKILVRNTETGVLREHKMPQQQGGDKCQFQKG